MDKWLAPDVVLDMIMEVRENPNERYRWERPKRQPAQPWRIESYFILGTKVRIMFDYRYFDLKKLVARYSMGWPEDQYGRKPSPKDAVGYITIYQHERSTRAIADVAVQFDNRLRWIVPMSAVAYTKFKLASP